MSQRNPSLRQWLKADVAGYLGLRKVVQLFKTDPRLWLWLIVYLGVPLALYGGALAAIGELDNFGTWIVVPTMIGVSSFGARLHSVWQMRQR